MLKVIKAALILTLLAGCGYKSKEPQPRYGKVLLQTIECDTILDCSRQVNQICPEDFNIYSKEKNVLVFWCSDWKIQTNHRELK